MSKQDRTYTRTAADLERKYNLGQLAQGVPEKNPDSEQVSKVAQELSAYKTAVNRKLQSIETSITEIQGVIGSGASVIDDSDQEVTQAEWKLHTEKSGTTGTITLPSTFKELHIVIGIANYMYTFNILADYLSSTDMTFRNGYCLSTSVYGDVYISVNKTAISGWTVIKENVVQNATVKAYYK